MDKHEAAVRTLTPSTCSHISEETLAELAGDQDKDGFSRGNKTLLESNLRNPPKEF